MKFSIFCALLLAGCTAAPSPIATPTPQAIPKEVVVSPEPSSSPSPVEPAPVVEPEEPAPEPELEFVNSEISLEEVPIWGNQFQCFQLLTTRAIATGAIAPINYDVWRSHYLPAEEGVPEEIRHTGWMMFPGEQVRYYCAIYKEPHSVRVSMPMPNGLWVNIYSYDGNMTAEADVSEQPPEGIEYY